MSRLKHLPLTETVFYVLLALKNPSHGYAVMQEVERLSGGEVRIAAGTMYGAIDNLLKKKLIKEVSSTDPRRKMYTITQSGDEVLLADCERLKMMIAVADTIFKEEKTSESV